MIPFDSLRISLLALLAVVGVSPLAQAIAPVAPSLCSAAASGGTTATVTVSWNDNSTNETLWVIYRSIGTGAYSEFGTYTSGTTATTGSTISVSWTTAAYDTVYHFRVAAYDGVLLSTVSNTATVGTYNLNGPTNLSVTALDPFNVTLRWEENSIDEVGFAIEKKVGTGAWEYLGAVGANVLSATANLIAPLESFSFRVRAFKAGAPTTPGSGTVPVNVSIYSNTFTGTAAAYTLSAVKVAGLPIVNLSWPDLPGEDGYQIGFKAPEDSAFSLLGEVAKNVTTYQATSPYIWPSKTYVFAVFPYTGTSDKKSMGSSSTPSVSVDAYTLTVTKVPGQPMVNLSWPDLPAESGYQILIKADGETLYSILGETAANVITYQAKSPDIWPSRTYSFVVRPFSGTSANIISESNVADVTIDAYTLTATKVTGQPIVNLSWPDLAAESGYQILVKADGDASYSILDETAANVTTYQAKSPYIWPGKTYFFVVQPFSGTSATIISETNVASATIDAYTLTATAVPGQATANLSWPDLTNEDGYLIVFKAQGDASYAILGEVAANVTTYQATAPTLAGRLLGNPL